MVTVVFFIYKTYTKQISYAGTLIINATVPNLKSLSEGSELIILSTTHLEFSNMFFFNIHLGVTEYSDRFIFLIYFTKSRDSDSA